MITIIVLFMIFFFRRCTIYREMMRNICSPIPIHNNLDEFKKCFLNTHSIVRCIRFLCPFRLVGFYLYYPLTVNAAGLFCIQYKME